LNQRSLTGCAKNMYAFRRKKKDAPAITRPEALASIPLKNPRIKEKRLDTGEVLLTYTVSIRPWFAGLVRRLGRERDILKTKEIHLDRLGTTVWDLINGNRSVRAIAVEFSKSYRLEKREAEVSVTQFLRELGKRGLIGLR